MTERPDAKIDVKRDVYEAAKKLENLDGLRGFDCYNFAEIIADFHQRQLDRNREGDPEDPFWIPMREQEIRFWQDVAEYLMALEYEAEDVQINIIDDTGE